MTMTLREITDRRPFGWFAVKQDLSPFMQWAKELRCGNSRAHYGWDAGPKPGSFTDAFFKRNWQLGWTIGCRYTPEPRTTPRTIQLLRGPDAGTASCAAIETLQLHCNEQEYGKWKLFLVRAYPYLTGGLNMAAHVRCIVECSAA